MSDRRTEALHRDGQGLHTLTGPEVMTRLLAAQTKALQAVDAAIPALVTAAELAAASLQAGGKLAYAGAGSSGLMALADCLELAGTFGIPPHRTPMLFAGGTSALLHMVGHVEDDADQALRDLEDANLSQGDTILCLAASGGTPYTLQVARAARQKGVRVVGLANVEGSALMKLADVPVLLDTGPELVAGSTRMGAATAQKVALNMISVLVGIRLGAVHDGQMVNLIADNAKLLIRARGIVASVAGCDATTAEAALKATAGAVKPAILVAKGAKPEDAARALKTTKGHLSPLLKT